VPGIPTSEDEGYCCPRCGEVLSDRPANVACVPRGAARTGASAKRMAKARAATAALDAEAVTAESCGPGDDWAVDEQLRHIARLLGVEPSAEMAADRPRRDAPHRGPSGAPAGAPPAPEPKAGPSVRRELLDWAREAQAWQARRVFPVLCWLAVLAGTMAGTCGVVLLVWSAVAGRPELRPVGMPIALAGAASLAVGLFYHLDRLRQQSSRPSAGAAQAAAADLGGPAIRIDAGTSSPAAPDLPAEQLAGRASVP